jgi:hypothetical protein
LWRRRLTFMASFSWKPPQSIYASG